jgi:hypothetical protein
MTDLDLTVTWQRPDGTTVDLPATLVFRDEPDGPDLRARAVVSAFDHNLSDFPDDIPDGSIPVKIAFSADD